jgi:GAF domain-containing protein
VRQGRGAESDAEGLGSELSALRRIALLVARAAPEPELLGAVAEEIGQVLGTEDVRIFRYEENREAVVVAARGDEDHLPLGSYQQLGGADATSEMLRTRQPARLDDVPDMATGTLTETAPGTTPAPAASRRTAATDEGRSFAGAPRYRFARRECFHGGGDGCRLMV